MSYHNQQQVAILNPKGIDRVIEAICTKLDTISWLSNIFRRAWLINNSNTGSNNFTPMVYLQNMEYYNVLPNDNFTALAFVVVNGQERYINQNEVISHNFEPEKERSISVIFWVNLNKINPAKDYIFTEELKAQIEPLLADVDGLTIESYIDEDYRQIFSGYDISETENKFFAYPYACFKFNCIVSYGGKYRNC